MVTYSLYAMSIQEKMIFVALDVHYNKNRLKGIMVVIYWTICEHIYPTQLCDEKTKLASR